MQLKKEFGEIFVFLYEKCPKTVLFVYFSLTLKELDHMTTRHMSVVWIVDKWYSDLLFICTLNSLDFLPHSNHLVWLKTIFWDPYSHSIHFLRTNLRKGFFVPQSRLITKNGFFDQTQFLLILFFEEKGFKEDIKQKIEGTKMFN